MTPSPNEHEDQQLRELTLRLGRPRLGPPSPAVLATLHAIHDKSRLLALVDRIVVAATWDDAFLP
jgi:hypothetical protein